MSFTNVYYLDFTGGSKEADFDALNLRCSNYYGFREGSQTKRWATPLILSSDTIWRMPISQDIYDNVLTSVERAACTAWDNAITPKESGFTVTEESHVTGAASASWTRDESWTPDNMQLESGDKFLLEDGSSFLLVESAVSNIIDESGNNLLLENGDLILVE